MDDSICSRSVSVIQLGVTLDGDEATCWNISVNDLTDGYTFGLFGKKSDDLCDYFL